MCTFFAKSHASLRVPIILVARFLRVFYLRILEHKGCVFEVYTSEKTPCDGPFLFLIFTWLGVSFQKCTLRLGPKDFGLFRKIDLDFCGSISWNTQPTCFDFFNWATVPFPPLFFGFSLG